MLVFRNKRIPARLETLDQVAALLDQQEANQLLAMQADGVAIDLEKGAAGRAYLVTTDAAVAKKYGMHDESELLDADEPSGDTDDHAP